jgi:type VI protein secretion system component VasF
MALTTRAALAARLEAVVPLTPLSADSRVGQYVLVEKAKASRAATTAAIVMAVLFALAFVAAAVLGYLLYSSRKERSSVAVGEAYPSLRAHDGTQAGWNQSAATGGTIAELA